MFINTQYFREAALYYEKHGRYDDGDYGSYECIDYWKREEQRVLNGYEVGGVKITGEHYLYLNYLPIQINTIEEKNTNVIKEQLFKSKLKASRGEGFASFWDSDYILFWTWEIAKEGVIGNTIEEKLENLKQIERHLSLPIIKTFNNLNGGKNHLWLKPRGMGASWKGASKAVRNQFFINDSETYFLAHEDKYLLDQGIYSKYLNLKDALLGVNKYKEPRCAGFRRTFSKQDITGMHFKASIVENRIVDGKKQLVEIGGKKSSVIGVTINNRPDNVRGKRGTIIYEEFGTFPGVERTWIIAQSSVEQEGIVFGNQYGFGTGGDDKAVNIRDLDVMFNNPQLYNILEFENIFDEDLYGMKSAYFTPATYSVTFIDNNGNTDLDLSYNSFIKPTRDLLNKASDSTAFTQFCAEKPMKPSEALLSIKGNRFPIKLLKSHLTRLRADDNYKNLITTGRFEKGEYGEVVFKKTNEIDKLFNLYPVPSGTTADAPIAIFKPPFKTKEGEIPKNLYRISVDPYRQDSSTGDSIGSVYVIENENNITPHKGNIIVAWYNARPNSQEDFNENLFSLAEYYNGKIAPENDELGGIIDYAKRKKKIHLLQEEFELAYDQTIKTKSTSKRKFGMHISSGKDNRRMLQGNEQIKDWLLTPLYKDEDGKITYVLNTIYDIGLLEELIKYNPNDNFDRISSLRVNTFFEKELVYKKKFVTQKKVRDPFLLNGFG